MSDDVAGSDTTRAVPHDVVSSPSHTTERAPSDAISSIERTKPPRKLSCTASPIACTGVSKRTSSHSGSADSEDGAHAPPRSLQPTPLRAPVACAAENSSSSYWLLAVALEAHLRTSPSWRSLSAWVGFATAGQLSTLPHTPSPSASLAGSSGQGSTFGHRPSPSASFDGSSGHGSHASP